MFLDFVTGLDMNLSFLLNIVLFEVVLIIFVLLLTPIVIINVSYLFYGNLPKMTLGALIEFDNLALSNVLFQLSNFLRVGDVVLSFPFVLFRLSESLNLNED